MLPLVENKRSRKLESGLLGNVPDRGVAAKTLRDTPRDGDCQVLAYARGHIDRECDLAVLQPFGIVVGKDTVYGGGKTRRDASVSVLDSVKRAGIGQTELLGEGGCRQLLLAQNYRYAFPARVGGLGCAHDSERSVRYSTPRYPVLPTKKCGAD